MRISDWSSDVCSSDLARSVAGEPAAPRFLWSANDGRSEAKDVPVPTGNATGARPDPVRRLCREPGYRRAAPPAPHRPEDRHVSRSAGAEGQGKDLSVLRGARNFANPRTDGAGVLRFRLLRGDGDAASARFAACCRMATMANPAAMLGTTG